MQITKRHVAADGATHRGDRLTNQDTLLVEEHLGLFAVLDGMGGAAAGELAAHIARDALVEFTRRNANNGYSRRELLEFSIDYAGADVHRHAKAWPEYAGMGTTVVACLLSPQNEIVLGHVGDSRAYLLRDGRLAQLTRDHNRAQQALDAGETLDDAKRRQLGSVLTRNLGHEHGAKADMLELALQVGDRLLLCSDGLSNYVSDENIQIILGLMASPLEIADTLIEMALCSPYSPNAKDNMTALVLMGIDEWTAEHADTAEAA